MAYTYVFYIILFNALEINAEATLETKAMRFNPENNINLLLYEQQTESVLSNCCIAGIITSKGEQTNRALKSALIWPIYPTYLSYSIPLKTIYEDKS